ncbi:BTAD domain-containing putative transcriptional regulator [Actinocrispum wychmicini]|uniref:DNA-binding SARP family transcriptional activator n=1 Tax=Actinocrispum wychmicini TaxID=1213861 RepID=A0A4R2JJA3_9PSEU|nr:BTAD domain-containing putative transcriptional regulator [Actinocrispum wychmicini]TCO54235.1 DNA-binding SARP family transcriptional activator [Actinocrispum wychmicini]
MTAGFRLLGDIEGRVDGRPVALGHQRQRSVLVVLLVEANRVVPVDQLVDRVWAGQPPHRARETLYGYVHRLRRALAVMAEVDIVRQPGGYLLSIDEDLIDLHRFRDLVRQARATDEDATALALFEEALALWRGGAFAGVDIPWLNGVREVAEKERFAAELDHTDLRLRHGQHTDLVAGLVSRASEHQWDERLAAQLMLALYRCGRQADALAHYEQTRLRLADELGIDPSPALRDLRQRILTADPELIVPVPQPVKPAAHSTSDSQLDLATRELAMAVTRQWTAEAETRSLHRPAPVRVRWSTTGRPVSAAAAGTDVLFGDIADVAAKFRALSVRQLVVLGEPGAGKTVLAILLTLGLLADRTPVEPTPVLLSLSSWNPHRDHLHSWLARRLVAEYPGLGNAGAYGPDAATRLVAEERVIPVLDGLDETPPGAHAAAIDALDQAIAGGRPLVVTCRAEEYETAVRHSGAILARAAVVEIEPVELDDAITFLTARRHLGDTRWQPVVEHLRHHPDGPLARVLSTPLMVDLARTAYTRPSSDPAELLDPSRFADRAGIEEHLLDSFVPAAYAHRPPPPGLPPAATRYEPEQGRRWLAFLARHLQRVPTRDFAWWRLVQEIPRPTRGLVFGLPAAVLFAITGLVVAGPMMALVYGLSTAAAGCAAHGWGTRPEPLRVEVRFQGTATRFLIRFAVGAAISVVIGLAWSLPVVVVLILAVVFGFGIGLHVWLKVPTGADRASTPAAAHRQDRVATCAFALSVALSIGLFYAFTIAVSQPSSGLGTVPETFYFARALPAGLVSALFGWFAFRRLGAVSYGLAGFVVGGQAMPHHIPLGLGLGAGALFGLAIGLVAAQSRSWGAYLVTRTWLALRGRTPLRLNRFLIDAHQRGVLRQAGAVHQFRHARLQDHLAD